MLEAFRDIIGVCDNMARGICEGFCGTSESTEKHNYCTLLHAVVAFSVSVSLLFLLMLTGGVGYLRKGDV